MKKQNVPKIDTGIARTGISVDAQVLKKQKDDEGDKAQRLKECYDNFTHGNPDNRHGFKRDFIVNVCGKRFFQLGEHFVNAICRFKGIAPRCLINKETEARFPSTNELLEKVNLPSSTLATSLR